MKRHFFFTMCVVLALAATMIGAQPVSAQTVVATIPVLYANKVAVNPITNRIYVTSYGGGNRLNVIDGTTNSVVATVPAGPNPWGVAVNPNTNLVYVVNNSNNSPITVVDGGTNTVVANIPVTGSPVDIAINPNTNRIYVTNWDTLLVIDGYTNAVVTAIPMETLYGVAVNYNNNLIYVANYLQRTVSVIDGSTNKVVATIPTPLHYPRGVAVNPSTNRIYVASGAGVSVIDGSANTVLVTVPLGDLPYYVAVNANTNRIYVTNANSDNLSVLDGSTNNVIATVPMGDTPVGVDINPFTNRIYVGNRSGSTVSVIQDPDNQTPTADAGGPYSINEDALISVTASGNDPEGGTLTYTWDLDNNGSFETPGQSVIFSAAELDGPSSPTIHVQVTDNGGRTATDQATVNVLNVSPTASFTSQPATLLQGQSATLAFSNPFDPGSADTAAGFFYSYDCTNDGTLELASASDASYTCAYPNAGTFNALGRIADKDGGFADYTVQVKVLTPREGTEGLIDQVLALVPGTLNEGQGNALIAKLQAAIQQLERGNITTGLNQLEAFINAVNAHISAGQLTLEEGQPLLDTANAIIAALGD